MLLFSVSLLILDGYSGCVYCVYSGDINISASQDYVLQKILWVKIANNYIAVYNKQVTWTNTVHLNKAILWESEANSHIRNLVTSKSSLNSERWIFMTMLWGLLYLNKCKFLLNIYRCPYRNPYLYTYSTYINNHFREINE